MRRLAAVLAAFVVFMVPASALAGRVTYDDTVAAGKPLAVTFTTHKAAAFKVVLRVSTQGRTQLFLTGKHAPKGGPLIDTKTFACEGAAGSFYCKASYEPLPAGTYTWRVVRKSGPREPVTLTVRW
jgi:hypothetical protein